MLNNIKYLNQHPYFLFLASISSILGLLLSIYLIYKSTSIARILKQMSISKDYNKKRTEFINKFKVYKNSILIDDVKNKNIVHDILELIYNAENQYRTLFSKFELFKLYQIKKYLKQDFSKIDFDIVCFKLDYLIGRFNKREDV